MKFTQLGIEGAWLAESQIWTDDRGFFREWFKSGEIKEATGIDFSVQQANISESEVGVIRGIHYSLSANGQAKWVTCTRGQILDVIVDLRPKSKTFMKIEYVELNHEDGRAILIGQGLGHGFVAKKSKSTVNYLLSTQFQVENEYGIHPFDERMGIDWGIDRDKATISIKDSTAMSVSDAIAEQKLPMTPLIESKKA
jgi:dTDP-4-dehydrorhamnose 3,5-epimerase